LLMAWTNAWTGVCPPTLRRQRAALGVLLYIGPNIPESSSDIAPRLVHDWKFAGQLIDAQHQAWLALRKFAASAEQHSALHGHLACEQLHCGDTVIEAVLWIGERVA